MPLLSLKHFVNRTSQTSTLSKRLVENVSRWIVIVRSDRGMGKTWLLKKFAQDLEHQEIPFVYINFRDHTFSDPVELVLHCSSLIGLEHFEPLTKTINDLFVPRVIIEDTNTNSSLVISAGTNNQFGDFNLHDFAGKNIIKNNQFVFNSENPRTQLLFLAQITKSFLKCLDVVMKSQKVVFLFDAYERTSLQKGEWSPGLIDKWIRDELLVHIRRSRLNRAIVVIAGRMLPSFDLEWSDSLDSLDLEPLSFEDTQEYLRERCTLSSLSDLEILRLHQASAGKPLLLGIMGDNLQNTPSTMPDDIWLS